MNTIKRIGILLLAAGLLLPLCGCRTRTNGAGQADHISAAAGALNGEPDGRPGPTGGAASGTPQENEEAERLKNDESGNRTRENPDASRKEYNENAPAEIIPGTDRLLHGEGEGDGASGLPDPETQKTVSRLNDRAEKPAVRTVAAGEAEEKGVSEDAENADSAMTYFTVLLEDRGGALYECQRASLYWETGEDYQTIHKSSTEHTLILKAGAYDVSARLLPENLRVDGGWVARKNPQVIVKIADSDILGSRISSAGNAKAVFQQLCLREGWQDIDAVKNRQILILSGELLDAPYLHTAAALMIAKTAYPDLYGDVDLQQALEMLAEEATGTIPAGIYYYTED